MTGRAVCLAQVLCVVENGIKAFQYGKRFHRSGFRIGVTNRADSVFVIGKLRRVTARARHMPDEFRCRRIVFALVTKRARKTRVFRV